MLYSTDMSDREEVYRVVRDGTHITTVMVGISSPFCTDSPIFGKTRLSEYPGIASGEADTMPA